MDGALHLLLLLGRELEAEQVARVRDGVMGAQPLELGLRLRRQRVVRRAHVGELRVGRHRRDDPRVEHRVAPRRIHERGVGVPEAIAERVMAPAIVGLHDRAVGVEIRDVGDRLVAEPALREGAAPGTLVQPTVEPFAERELLGVGERLIAEDENGVLVHAGADRGQRVGVEDAAKLDRARFAHEVPVEFAECQGHSLMRLGRRGAASQAIARRKFAERSHGSSGRVKSEAAGAGRSGQPRVERRQRRGPR